MWRQTEKREEREREKRRNVSECFAFVRDKEESGIAI